MSHFVAGAPQGGGGELVHIAEFVHGVFMVGRMIGSGVHVSPVGDIEVHAVLEHLIIFEKAHQHHFRFHNLVVGVDERLAVRSVGGEVLGREGDVCIFPHHIEVALGGRSSQASPVGASVLGTVEISVHVSRCEMDLDGRCGFIVFRMVQDVYQPALLYEELVDAFGQIVCGGIVEAVVIRTVQVLNADL